MDNKDKIQLFERTPVPNAVAKLAIPTVLSSLVMVIYNLADTFFVGMPAFRWRPRFFWLLMRSITCLAWELPA